MPTHSIASDKQTSKLSDPRMSCSEAYLWYAFLHRVKLHLTSGDLLRGLVNFGKGEWGLEITYCTCSLEHGYSISGAIRQVLWVYAVPGCLGESVSEYEYK
jgi:hypothetical protein